MPILRIIEVIDGLGFFCNCAFGLKTCSDENPCAIHKDFKVMRDQFEKVLGERTVKDFSDDIKSGRYVL